MLLRPLSLSPPPPPPSPPGHRFRVKRGIAKNIFPSSRMINKDDFDFGFLYKDDVDILMLCIGERKQKFEDYGSVKKKLFIVPSH